MIRYEAEKQEVERTLEQINEAATLYQKVAFQTGELAKGVAEVHKAPNPNEIAPAEGQADKGVFAKLAATLQALPNPSKLAWYTSSLRRLHAMLIAQETDLDKAQLHMVEISQKVDRSSSMFLPEEDPDASRAAAEVQGLVKQAKAGLDQYSSLTAKFSVILGTLAESVSLAYLELQAERDREREEAQRKFERRMERIGVVIALAVAIFTFVSTVKAIGWI